MLYQINLFCENCNFCLGELNQSVRYTRLKQLKYNAYIYININDTYIKYIYIYIFIYIYKYKLNIYAALNFFYEKY